MTVKFTNNANSTLSSGINSSVTSMTVADASSFPSLSGANDYCYLTLQESGGTTREIVKATARSSNTFTIVRGQDNTSAATWSSGVLVELRITSALLQDVIDGLGSGSMMDTDIFAGDGSDTTFTLSRQPDNENNLLIFIDGVFQAHNAYSVSGTTLTLSAAPANGRVITAYHMATTVGGSNLIKATMTGDNSDTTLDVGSQIIHENNVQVYFDGVYQSKGNYSVSGSVITFSTAPPTGVAVEAILNTATNISTATQLADADSDTLIQVEESSDEDKIRFDIAGTEEMVMDATGIVINDGSNDRDFRIESNGNTHALFLDGGNDRVLFGTTASRSMAGVTPSTFIEGLNYNSGSLGIVANSNATNGAYLTLGTSRGTSVGASTIVQDDDEIGGVWFNAADGTDINSSVAAVAAYVDGTPGENDTPGRLVFSTTADGAQAVTERMRIDSSGKVLIGTTASRAMSGVTPNFFIEGTSYADSGLGAVINANGAIDCPVMLFGKSRGTSLGSNTVVQNGDRLFTMRFDGSDGTNLEQAALIEAYVDAAPANNSVPGRLSFWTTNDGSQYATEKMRLDNSGRLGLGGTATYGKLDIRQTGTGAQDRCLWLDMAPASSGSNNNAMVINVANANMTNTVMRIHHESPAANQPMFVIDTTGSNTVKFQVDEDGDVLIAKGTDDADTVGAQIASFGGFYSSVNGSVYNTYHYRDTSSTSYKFYVNGSGQVSSTSTSIALISDARLKENVRDYEAGGLAEILKLQPRVFDWKENEGKNIKNDVGFIAQEFEEVFPDWVGGWLHDELEDAKSVSTGELIYPMVNAIKELSTEIESLKAEVKALKEA